MLVVLIWSIFAMYICMIHDFTSILCGEHLHIRLLLLKFSFHHSDVAVQGTMCAMLQGACGYLEILLSL